MVSTADLQEGSGSLMQHKQVCLFPLTAPGASLEVYRSKPFFTNGKHGKKPMNGAECEYGVPTGWDIIHHIPEWWLQLTNMKTPSVRGQTQRSHAIWLLSCVMLNTGHSAITQSRTVQISEEEGVQEMFWS